MKIIFAEKDGVERFAGYSKVDYSSDSETETVVEASESELNGLIPDSFDGNWKENKAYFILDSTGEIAFDENFEPKNKVAE